MSFTRRERMYTFGLLYTRSHFDPELKEPQAYQELEEIDVMAINFEEARRKAIELADDDYEPGYKLVNVDPGGTAGMVTIQSW